MVYGFQEPHPEHPLTAYIGKPVAINASSQMVYGIPKSTEPFTDIFPSLAYDGRNWSVNYSLPTRIGAPITTIHPLPEGTDLEKLANNFNQNITESRPPIQTENYNKPQEKKWLEWIV